MQNLINHSKHPRAMLEDAFGSDKSIEEKLKYIKSCIWNLNVALEILVECLDEETQKEYYEELFNGCDNKEYQ